MTLLELQREFHAGIVSEDEAPPASAGHGVYRNAYRAQLLGALATSFERTRRWAGAEAFEAAAIDYVIAHPPVSWTLDDYGAGFPARLSALFADDSEVGELAWLEWHMQRAFAAPDEPALDPAQLTALSGADFAWDQARFGFVRSLAVSATAAICASLWPALAEDADPPAAPPLEPAAPLMVWRQHLTPRFRRIDPAEHAALTAALGGASFGEICGGLSARYGEAQAAERAGGLLGQWLGEGLIARLD